MALVSDPQATVSKWSRSTAPGLEDFYQVHVRSADDDGNVSNHNTIWRGIFDMSAPSTSISAQHVGGGSAAQTEISFSAADPFLDTSRIDVLCPEHTWQMTTYHVDVERVERVTGTCRVTVRYRVSIVS